MRRKIKQNSKGSDKKVQEMSALSSAPTSRKLIGGLFLALVATCFMLQISSMSGKSAEAETGAAKAKVQKRVVAKQKSKGLEDKLFQKPKLVAAYDHDSEAFTQGLLVHEGVLYESTGMYGGDRTGPSDVRKVDIETGKVLQKTALDGKVFGEGMEVWDGQLVQLTWREKTVLFWDMESLTLTKQMPMPPTVRNEGWGLTQNGTYFIMSDGSAWLFWWDPVTLQEVERKQVLYRGKPLQKLNELEFVGGFVFANVWYDDHLYVIDPTTARVVHRWNYKKLHDKVRTGREDCFNGIAYDRATSQLYVTGKWWSKMFKLDLSHLP